MLNNFFKFMIKVIKKFLAQWRMRRSAVVYARTLGVKIGDNCKLVALQGGTFGTEPYLVRLGNHVEVSYDVRFITHDGGVWVGRTEHPDLDVMNTIEVGDNVFIGARSIILPGSRIGHNCVIGAGSLVRGEIPAGSVVAGVPAKFIKTTDSYIEQCVAQGVRTKLMSADEKKSHLLKHFGIK